MNMIQFLTMTIEGLPQVDRERIVQVVSNVLVARTQEGSIINVEPPEKQFITLIKENLEDRVALNALFFVTSCVLAQNTFYFFRRISDPALLERYGWIFQPEIVIELGKEAVEEACQSYLRPAGYSIHAVRQWYHNCEILHDSYGDDIRRFFEQQQNDAIRIIDSLVVAMRAKAKTGFRRFGPKLSRLLIQWLHQYDMYSLENPGSVGLPIDWQVARVLIQTSGIILERPVQAHTLMNGILLPLLRELCNIHDWIPQEVSEALWLLGSLGCAKKLHALCPVSDLCTISISRKPYDKDGLFDPTDTGRFKDP